MTVSLVSDTLLHFLYILIKSSTNIVDKEFIADDRELMEAHKIPAMHKPGNPGYSVKRLIM